MEIKQKEASWPSLGKDGARGVGRKLCLSVFQEVENMACSPSI